jgi:hypothetical protein
MRIALALTQKRVERTPPALAAEIEALCATTARSARIVSGTGVTVLATA